MLTKYDIAANVTLLQLEGFEGRMTAALQRKVFGRAVVGKKIVHIDTSNQGRYSDGSRLRLVPMFARLSFRLRTSLSWQMNQEGRCIFK
jgi:hypothetical protein